MNLVSTVSNAFDRPESSVRTNNAPTTPRSALTIFCLLFAIFCLPVSLSAQPVQYAIQNSPPHPPKDAVRPVANLAMRSIVTLDGVPTSTWTYGCTATSAGMLFGYYDRHGYPNMYTGPTNGGVAPLTDLGQGDNPYRPISGSCSIIATQAGFDGRTTGGHVDEYWISYDSAGPDPWEAVGVEHTWGDCTADFMGTNQWKWAEDIGGGFEQNWNYDGATTVWYYTGGSEWHDPIPNAIYGLPQTACCHGMRLFAESRGYTVTMNYNQLVDSVGATYGFTFSQYMDEIDSGHPVLIHVTNHTMLGVGYDPTSQTVFLHDTWDNLVHSMTWGGDYAGLDMQAVTVFHLDFSECVDCLDCNNNGVSDEVEVSLGNSPDANGNGVPDECEATRIFVDDDAPLGGDGLTWETAYRYLQDALHHDDSPVNEIYVAAGTYKPDQDEAGIVTPGDRNTRFSLKNGVSLYGGYAGYGAPDPNLRDINTNATILSGDLTGNDGPDFANYGDNCYHVVNGTTTNETAIIDGFTITAGYADYLSSQDHIESNGGGMFLDPGSPTVRFCKFVANKSENRGAALAFFNSTGPFVENCEFSSNYSNNRGGGAVFAGAPATFTDCTFSDNTGAYGGAMRVSAASYVQLHYCDFSDNVSFLGGGGALFINSSTVDLLECELTGNNTTNGGDGGAAIFTGSNATVINCTIENNISADDCGGFEVGSGTFVMTGCTFRNNRTALTDSLGGAMEIFSQTTPAIIKGCTFDQNSAANGGALRIQTSTISIEDSIFTNNEALQGGAIDNVTGNNTTITNSRFFANQATHDQGGAIANYDSSQLHLSNCIFTANASTNSAGGALGLNNGSGSITNCTIYRNTAHVTGGGFSGVNFSADITNCIFRANTDNAGLNTDESAQVHVHSGAVNITYSDVQAWTGALGGAGNTGLDPLFIDPDGDDNVIGTEDDNLRLSAGSPIIDQGDNDALIILVDLDENLRRYDDPATPDGGNPGTLGAPVVDMGAYEYSSIATPSRIYVDQNVSGGTGDGTSWANAYPELRDALDFAHASLGIVQEIWVATGTYLPTDTTDRTATFQLRNNLAIYGGFDGTENPATFDLADRDFEVNPAVLLGDLADNDGPNFTNYTENSYHVVTATEVGATAVLDGFIISGGSADAPSGDLRNRKGGGLLNESGSPTVRNCVFDSNQAVGAGGAVHNDVSGTPTYAHCRFDANRNYDGGGGAMWNEGTVSPTITECQFTDNNAFGYGGAIFNRNGADATVDACTFTNNYADHGGAVWNYTANMSMIDCRFDQNSANQGGAVHTVDGSMSIDSCTFINNTSVSAGGAVRNDNSSPTITNCLFAGNSSIGSAGGAIVNTNNADPNFVNCVIVGNTSYSVGGALYTNAGSDPVLTNCTVVGNQSGQCGGIYLSSDGSTTLVNSIIWANSDSGGSDESAQIYTDGGLIDADFCNISGWSGDFSGIGTIDTNPLFIDPDGPDDIIGTEDDDLRLSGGSLCTDAGNNNATGLVGITTDLDGNPRFQDDSNTPDTGLGTPPIVDMGAYESDGSAPAPPIIFVDDSATGANDGTTWENAFVNLQDALTAARTSRPANRVWVATGTYYPDEGTEQTDNSRESSFRLQTGLHIYGGFDGTEDPETFDLADRNFDSNGTILSGDLTQNDGPNFTNYEENSYHVVTAQDLTRSTTLDGVTIERGMADNTSVLHDYYAGGLYCSDSTVTLANASVRHNSAWSCGAIVTLSGRKLLIIDCAFDHNRSDTEAAGAIGVASGGAMECYGSAFAYNSASNEGGAVAIRSDATVIMQGCTFAANYANESGGGIHTRQSEPIFQDCRFESNSSVSGGAVYSVDTVDAKAPTFLDCIFSNNSASSAGGAIHTSRCIATCVGCSFLGNTAFSNGGAVRDDGGPGQTSEGGPGNTYINCLFTGNSATDDPAMGYGGAVHSDRNDPTFINCTLYGNQATVGGGIYNWTDIATYPALSNCVLWNNADDGGTDESAQIFNNDTLVVPAIDFSNIQGWTGALGGTGNIGSDAILHNPDFIDPNGPDDIIGTEDDNLRFFASSPCIDAGSNLLVSADTFDLDADSNTAEPLPFDLDYTVRFFDYVPATDCPNGGNCGTAPIVDMGAYEFSVTDCNNNGLDDAQDIALGTSLDCNYTEIPDECELDGNDCNSNGVPDECDPDCNENDIPDDCDVASGASLDCNTTGIPDECELTANDCNSNSIPDECEADCNDNGEPDDCDLASGAADDCNNNAIPDTCDIDAGISEDDNGDEIPDECQVRNLTQGTAYDTIAQAIAAAYDDDELLASPIHFAAEPTIDFADLAITLRSSDYITQPIGGNTTLADDAKLATAPSQAMLLHGTVETTIGDYAELQAGSLTLATTGQIYAPSASIINFTTDTINDIGGCLTIDPNATVALSQPTSLSGTLTINGGLLDTPSLSTVGEVSSLIGYGDLKTDLYNYTVATFLADTQLIGDMLNDGTTTIQSGILTIMGSLSGSGDIVGDFYGKSGNNGLTITGNFNAPSNAKLTVDSGTIKIGGDANIAIANYEEFDLTTSTLQMVGLPDDGPQTLEALAPDNGRDVTLPNTELFSINRLRIGPTATTILLTDNHDNAPGATTEALYVSELVLEKNTTLDLQGTRIYYNTVDPTDPFDPASDVTVIDSVGGGDLIPIGSQIKGDWNDNARVQLDDYPTLPDCLDGPDLEPDPQSPLTAEDCLAVFDFNDDGDVDLTDFAAFQTALEVQGQ